MIIYIDIDDTICQTDKQNYKDSSPIPSRIEKINKLKEAGNTIVYCTARGTETGIDWSDLTLKQLEAWGAKHDSLMMGKPAFDLFIDDKAISAKRYFDDN